VTEAVERELVMLPPVADDPVFSEPLCETDEPLRSRLGQDAHDFPALYIRHRWSFQLHARRFLSDQRDIDEVVQEGFLKLFLALPELETELQALAYGRRTITNLCIDRYRADQRRPRLVDLESIPSHSLPEDDEADPVVQAEDAAIVREALAMLSPLHRNALVMREIEEKPLPQIAVELDIPVEQVKHVLHRARRSLRRLLVGTHVEPGVDLDLALVLEANRARAARAAKPTGAAVVAVLLVLVALAGLRPGTRPRPLVQAAPSSAPGGGLIAIPGSDPVPSAPAKSPVVTSPVSPPRPGQGAAPARPRSTKPASTPAAPAEPATPSRPEPVTDGGSTPPVAVPVQPATYLVTGVGASGSARVSDQQRALRAAGTTSTSTLSATTATGTYALRQSFTFAADRSLVAVSFNEAVPVAGGGAVGTLMSSANTSVETLEDGAVRILSAGTASPLAEVNGQVLAPRALTIEVVLAPDLVQVVSERVHVVESAPTAPTPPTAPTAPAITPNAVPEAAGSPVAVPQVTPGSSGSVTPPAPLPPGGEVSVMEPVAVIAQDQGLR
jgi:RNA polymerase sigma factor (sigma-70 family)